MRISISCGPFTEKNTVEIEKQQSHPRRAQQSRARRQSAAVLPSYAPHDSKARLQHKSTRRDPWRSHVHRTRFRRPRSSSSADLPMCGVEGQDPSSFLSGVQGGYSLSRKRVSPFIRAAPSAAPLLRTARGTLPVSLFRETKSPRRERRGLLAVLCVYF